MSKILFSPRENKIHIFKPPRNVLILLYKSPDDGVFDDFPKISDHFPKISENFPKLFRMSGERSRKFSENFRKFPKVSEDCRRLPKTFEEDPKMFRWYTNEFKYNLRDKLDVSEIIDIDIVSSSISYRFYQFLTTRYTTDFYIINVFVKHLELLLLFIQNISPFRIGWNHTHNSP